ncbi:MAG: Ig-like domain-containing protein, partial [Termitinemataceae bacterium]
HTVEFSIDDGPWQVLSVTKDSKQPNKLIGELLIPGADGARVLRLRATNGLGRSTELQRTINRDTQQPFGRIILPPDQDPVNGQFTIAAQFADEGGRLAQLFYSQDAGKNWAAWDSVSFISQRYDLSAKTAIPDQIRFKAVDAAGNSTEVIGTFNLDVSADKPRVQIMQPEELEVLRSDFLISGAAFDDDGIKSVFYRFDKGEYQELPIEGNSFSIPVKLADTTDNEHSIEVYGVDIYGVAGDPVARNYRISKEEPKAAITSPSLDTTVRGIIDITGTASDANGIQKVLLSFDNAVTFNLCSGTNQWTYRLDTRNLKSGLHSIYVKPIDNYETTGFFAGLISIDNTAPQVTLDLPIDMSVTRGALVLSGRLSDDTELASCTALVFSKKDPDRNSKTFTLPLEPVIKQTVDLTGLPNGEYGIRIVAKDRAGNETVSSRDFVLDSTFTDETIAIASPVRGEYLSGKLRVQGFLKSLRRPSAVSLLIDGVDTASIAPNSNGWFVFDLGNDLLSPGQHALMVRYTNTENKVITSETVTINFAPSGPWVLVKAFASGDYVPGRPWLEGSAGWFVSETDQAEERRADETAVAENPKKLNLKTLAKTRQEGRTIQLVEVSLDNGRTFLPAIGTERWKFRLETQEYPEGLLPLLIRATSKNRTQTVTKVLLNLDKTPPQATLLQPVEGGRYNQTLNAYGTAQDDVELATIKVVLRQGDKAGYEVPAFIQGLYLDSGVFGDTLYNAGLGLTFFDDNVKLQASYGYTPDIYNGEEQRFYGAVFSGKLLANVAAIPFGYFFGPDWNFLSANLAVGAKFSYFTQTSSGQPLILSAVVSQLEFPRLHFDRLSYFSTLSMYSELQAWFISAEVEGGIAYRVSFGLRTSIF